MASNSYPRPGYNSGAVTDVEYEALAAQYANDGLVGLPTDPVMAYGDSSGRQVKVRASRKAIVRGRVYDSGGSDIILSIGANSSGSTRVDLVVLRLDRSTSAVTEAVVAGTPGAGPPAVTQSTGTSGTYEIPLAQVTVVNGASTIAATDVTPLAWYVSPSGTVMCTSTTRPTGVPRRTGMTIQESDTGLRYTWDGTAWRLLLDDNAGKGARDITRVGDNSILLSGITGETTVWSRTITQGIESGRLYTLFVAAACFNTAVDYTAVRLRLYINGTQHVTSGYVPLWRVGFPKYVQFTSPPYVSTSGSLAIELHAEVLGGGTLSIGQYPTEPFVISISDTRRNAAGIIHT